MATDLERLVVSLEANIKKYESALAKAQSATDKTARNIESRFNKIVPSFAGVQRGIAAVGAATGTGVVFNQVKKALDDISRIQDLSERAKVSTDFIQAVGHAVEQAGGSMEDATKAAVKLGKELGEVGNESSYLARLFKANGVDIKSFGGDAEKAFAAFAKIVANAKNPAEALNMIAGVFGEKVGPKMNSTLEKIATVGLPAFIEQAKAAGQVIDKELVKRGDDVADKYADLEKQLANFWRTSVIEAANAWRILWDNTWGQAQVPAISPEGRGAPKIVVSSGAPSRNVSGTAAGVPKLDDLKRAIVEAEKQVALMQKEVELIDATTAEREKALLVIKLETAAKEANREAGMKNTEVTDAQRVAILKVAAAFGEAKQKIEEANLPLRQFAREGKDLTKNMQTVGVKALESFENELINIGFEAKNAKEAFNDMVKGIMEDIARLLIRLQITAPIAQALAAMLNPTGGFTPGGIGSVAGAGAGPKAITVPKIEAAGAAAPRVEIKNYGTAKVEAGGTRKEAGGARVLEILVDSMVGKSIGTPGTASDRAMVGRGVGFPLHRRG